jgi:hypothetical protein
LTRRNLITLVEKHKRSFSNLITLLSPLCHFFNPLPLAVVIDWPVCNNVLSFAQFIQIRCVIISLIKLSVRAAITGK